MIFTGDCAKLCTAVAKSLTSCPQESNNEVWQVDKRRHSGDHQI